MCSINTGILPGRSSHNTSSFLKCKKATVIFPSRLLKVLKAANHLNLGDLRLSAFWLILLSFLFFNTLTNRLVIFPAAFLVFPPRKFHKSYHITPKVLFDALPKITTFPKVKDPTKHNILLELL